MVAVTRFCFALSIYKSNLATLLRCCSTKVGSSINYKMEDEDKCDVVNGATATSTSLKTANEQFWQKRPWVRAPRDELKHLKRKKQQQSTISAIPSVVYLQVLHNGCAGTGR